MIYLIDNDNQCHQGRVVFFVDACEGFGRWFAEKLIPWQKEILVKRGYLTASGYHKIISGCPILRSGFSKSIKVWSWKQYLEMFSLPGEPRGPEPEMPKYVAKDWNTRGPLPELTLHCHLFRLIATDKYAKPTIMVKTTPLHQRKQAAIVFALAALVEKVVERVESGQVDPADWEVTVSTDRVWTIGAVGLYSKKYPEREAEALKILEEACDIYYNQASQEDKEVITIRRENPHG